MILLLGVDVPDGGLVGRAEDERTLGGVRCFGWFHGFNVLAV